VWTAELAAVLLQVAKEVGDKIGKQGRLHTEWMIRYPEMTITKEALSCALRRVKTKALAERQATTATHAGPSPTLEGASTPRGNVNAPQDGLLVDAESQEDAVPSGERGENLTGSQEDPRLETEHARRTAGPGNRLAELHDPVVEACTREGGMVGRGSLEGPGRPRGTDQAATVEPVEPSEVNIGREEAMRGAREILTLAPPREFIEDQAPDEAVDMPAVPDDRVASEVNAANDQMYDAVKWQECLKYTREQPMPRRRHGFGRGTLPKDLLEQADFAFSEEYERSDKRWVDLVEMVYTAATYVMGGPPSKERTKLVPNRLDEIRKEMDNMHRHISWAYNSLECIRRSRGSTGVKPHGRWIQLHRMIKGPMNEATLKAFIEERKHCILRRKHQYQKVKKLEERDRARQLFLDRGAETLRPSYQADQAKERQLVRPTAEATKQFWAGIVGTPAEFDNKTATIEDWKAEHETLQLTSMR